MESGTEKEFIHRIRSGKPEAFSELLQQYQHKVYALIFQIVSSREDAEELTQDVFVKVFRKLGSFRGEATISTWIYRIAYNTAISAIRRKKPVFINLDEKAINEVPDEMIDEVLSREQDEKLLHRIQQAVGKLNPEEKALISLFYTQGRSIKEIASVMKLSGENVKVKLFRTRRKIVWIINQAQND